MFLKLTTDCRSAKKNVIFGVWIFFWLVYDAFFGVDPWHAPCVPRVSIQIRPVSGFRSLKTA